MTGLFCAIKSDVIKHLTITPNNAPLAHEVGGQFWTSY